jgi:acetyl esterase/lipase
MSSRHLVDPQLLPLIDATPPLQLTNENLAFFRANSEQFARQNAVQIRDDITVEERLVPGPKDGPDVRVVVTAPKNKTGSCGGYLHIHGGGYVLGSAALGSPRNMITAAEVGCVVVSVNYRLAPETVFPGAVEDCYAGLKWLWTHADALGVDRNRIAIGGESAGGGLAAGLGLLIRDRGEFKPVHQQLVYPMLDDRSCTDTHGYTGEFIWTRQSNHFGWSSILGHEPGGPDVSPYAAAARANDLSGLPPTFISTGALDLFCDENIEYARRLNRAGVPVELHVYPGAVHGFDMLPGTWLADRHAKDQLDAMRRALGPRS